MDQYSNRPTLNAVFKSIAARYYYSSVLLGAVGVVLLALFKSVPPFFGWLLMAWFAIETVIKIMTKVSKK